MSKPRIFLFLTLTLLMFSCKKEITTASFDFVPDKIDFDYLKVKSKMEYMDQAQKTKATLHIRVKKDETIWMSVQHTIEAFRIMIKPDSVYVIDRLAKKYHALSYGDLQKRLGFELNYDFFESMITANIPEKMLEEGKQLSKGNMRYLIKKEGYYQFEYFVSETLRHVEMIRVTEIPSSNAMEINYKSYAENDKTIYPNEIIAKISYKSERFFSKSDISIRHNTFDVLKGDETLSFPFNVPDKYARN